MKALFRFFGGLFLSIAITACAPAVVRFQPGEIPRQGQFDQQELTFATQSPTEFLTNAGYPGALPIEDDASLKRIERVVGRLLAQTPTTSHWRIQAVVNPEWNAMTMPGNNIVILSGLLRTMSSDDELAAVLGHEISHRLAKHHNSSFEKEMGSFLPELVAQLLAQSMIKDGASAEEAQGAAQFTNEFVKGVALNPYLQVQETEADLIGLFLMADAGYDPRAALKVWEERSRENGGDRNDFFSTHPASIKRSEYIKQNLTLALSRYKKALKNGVQSKFIKAQRTRYARHEITRSASAARATALAIDSMSHNQLQSALSNFKIAIAADPNYMTPVNFFGNLMFRNGNLKDSRKVFEKMVEVAPDFGTGYYNLACTQVAAGESTAAVKNLKQAIAKSPYLKYVALTDNDLQGIAFNPDVQKLLAPPTKTTLELALW